MYLRHDPPTGPPALFSFMFLFNFFVFCAFFFVEFDISEYIRYIYGKETLRN